MISEIKSIQVENVDFNRNFVPDDKTNFNFLLRVMIGLEGNEAEESFDLEVCSISWAENYLERNGVLVGRHLIIMKEYHYEVLEKKVLNLFAKREGSNWEEIASYFSRFGYWEFEDYSDETSCEIRSD